MSLNGQRLAIIGAGNMGEALLRGLLGASLTKPETIVATGRRAERLEYLRESYGIATTTDNAAAVADAEVILLAVKPQIMDRVLGQIAPDLEDDALVISVAAGRTIASIEKHLHPGVHVWRAMPNTPAIVGMGATGIAAREGATDGQEALVRELFLAVGSVIRVDESLMDAVTGLSGSGPAYVMMIIEALADAGVKVGLPRYQAQTLAAQTVLGSARLLIDTNEHPGVLKDRVTSPGGAAIAGLHTLEEGGLRTTLINAVEAATARSKELGESQDE